MTADCRWCGGTGRRSGFACSTCHGEGTVNDTEAWYQRWTIRMAIGTGYLLAANAAWWLGALAPLPLGHS